MVREPGARFETWKQIAGFFGREVRTVQRWEKTLALPVHRYRNAKQDSVYAFEHELKAWREERRQAAMKQPVNGQPVAETPVVRSWEASASSAAAAERGWLRKRSVSLAAGLATAIVIATVLALKLGVNSEKAPNDLAPTTFAALAGDPNSPTFSPDGHQIAFTWNGAAYDVYNLYVKDVDAFSWRRLTTDAEVDYSPAWSPDGKWLAFCRGTRVHKAALFLLSMGAKSRETKILDLDEIADPGTRVISWSPDSKRLALADTQGHFEQSLYLLDLATDKPKRITFPVRLHYDFHPSFSPKGNRIAFIRQNGEKRSELHLLTLGREGATKDEVIPLGSFERDRIGLPSWTPDSNYIVFTANHNGETGLWLVEAKATAPPPRFVGVGRDVTQTAISRTGQLAYVHRSRGVGLWRSFLETDATPQQVIGSHRMLDSAIVSPQGDKLAFSSNREGNMNIWVSGVDGSSAHPVTLFKGPLAGSPSWSPDGSQLAFDVHEEGGTAVYTVASGGGVSHKVTRGKNFDGVPFWAPDNEWIYFTSDRTGGVEIWKIHPDGTGAEQVTKRGGFAGKLSPDGKRLYYMRTRESYSPLFELDLATGRERLVNPAVFDRAYAATNSGVVFVPMESKNVFQIYSFDCRSGRVTSIRRLAERPHLGLSLTPDQKTLYYAQEDAIPAQIFLIQDFWR